MTIYTNIEDLRVEASKRVPKPFFEYVENGSYDELTLRANRRDLDAIRFRQRVMLNVSERKHGGTMLGKPVTIPLALAPTGLCGSMCANGEIKAARAAQRFGVPFCLSTMSLDSIEDVAGAVDQPFWFQLYLMKDRKISESLINRAKAAGCSALVLTMDLHVEGQRNRDVKNGLGIPPKLTPANIWSIVSHPGWALPMLRASEWTFGNLKDEVKNSGDLGELAEWVKSQFDPTFDWHTIDWVRQRWGGKLIIKGVLDPDDAKLAIKAGADAVLVSNHGGRQLDGAASTASQLPAIRDAIGKDDVELWADSGIRSGQDVLKFLSMGATACMIGRAYLYGLGAAGEDGVIKALELIRDEMDVTMALTGLTDASKVPPSLILGAPRRSAEEPAATAYITQLDG
ncbi:L-lactate dehydrogenase [Sphingomonas changbaiensis NBRC 104936]|uniref:L-lactate dehydrogenase n=1 Tax=Sphingomonas changbaiensis NBRC 104936 TaxID=1219043 RepID=A0A0E9MM29_9SPHN|nr:alpha-hydroxy acid oxidase [Sphingomonas changbaiensis]GAO38461.1 L-lactate dehydrogenase [Sphingomonas changbaiensis NBRC 104936]